MNLVTLAMAKKQLNLETYFTDDDAYISSLIDVAFYSIKNYCRNTTWVDSPDTPSGTTDYCDNTITGTTIPFVISQAILILVANFYANREPVAFTSATQIPYTLEYLLAPYVNYYVPPTWTGMTYADMYGFDNWIPLL